MSSRNQAPGEGRTGVSPVARRSAGRRPLQCGVDRRRLPIGIQTFRQIREEGYYYVDKTAYARRIASDAGKHYFLSRPRRFGKSLFLDTLKKLYEGAQELFRGLAVHDGWDWSRRHPVLRLSFGAGNFRRPGTLAESATTQLEDIGRRAGVAAGGGGAPVCFRRLLEALSEQAGRRVVVLVDEYDKPILDALDEPDLAKANRDDLRGLYGTIKDCDAYVELTFITGVSRFSRVSLFSDLNNLLDLTVDPDYSAICGYTEADLDAVFAPELAGLDRDAIRAWYNGYSWLGAEKVYNPFGLLKLFRSREFEAHWFETATPRFLVDTLIRRGFAAPDLEQIHASAALLSAFDVDRMAPEALLFQTGYLTIVDVERHDGQRLYRLGYPNREVRRGLNEGLLDALAPNWRVAEGAGELRRRLVAKDWGGRGGGVSAAAGGHSARRASTERHRALRGLLVERVLRLLSVRDGRGGRGGSHQPRPAGPRGAAGDERLPVRVQGGGAIGGRRGPGPVAGARLRGQAPRSGARGPPDRRGDKRGIPRRRGFRRHHPVPVTEANAAGQRPGFGPSNRVVTPTRRAATFESPSRWSCGSIQRPLRSRTAAGRALSRT